MVFRLGHAATASGIGGLTSACSGFSRRAMPAGGGCRRGSDIGRSRHGLRTRWHRPARRLNRPGFTGDRSFHFTRPYGRRRAAHRSSLQPLLVACLNFLSAFFSQDVIALRIAVQFKRRGRSAFGCDGAPGLPLATRQRKPSLLSQSNGPSGRRVFSTLSRNRCALGYGPRGADVPATLATVRTGSSSRNAHPR